jgi:hypothetical protein
MASDFGSVVASPLHNLARALNAMDIAQAKEEKKIRQTAAEAAGVCAGPVKPPALSPPVRDDDAMRISELVFGQLEQHVSSRAEGLEGQLAILLQEKQQWMQQQQEMNEKFICISAQIEATNQEMANLHKSLAVEAARGKEQQHQMDVFLEGDLSRFFATQHELDKKLSAVLEKQESDDRLSVTARDAQVRSSEMSSLLVSLHVDYNLQRVAFDDATNEAEILTQLLQEARARVKTVEMDWLQGLNNAANLSEVFLKPSNRTALSTEAEERQREENRRLSEDLRQTNAELTHAKGLLQNAAILNEQTILETASLLRDMLKSTQ